MILCFLHVCILEGIDTSRLRPKAHTSQSGLLPATLKKNNLFALLGWTPLFTTDRGSNEYAHRRLDRTDLDTFAGRSLL